MNTMDKQGKPGFKPILNMAFRCFQHQDGISYHFGHIPLENEPNFASRPQAQNSQALGRPGVPAVESVPGANLPHDVRSLEFGDASSKMMSPTKSSNARVSTKSAKDDARQSSIAKARFENACQLLHKQILEKEDRLTISELSFLNRLLNDDNAEPDTDVLSIDLLSDGLSATERSLYLLDVDPLWRKPPSSPDKNLRTSQRLKVEEHSRSQSPSNDSAEREDVLSIGSSHFSVGNALNAVSILKTREENIFFENCGSAEQSIFSSHSLEPECGDSARHKPSLLSRGNGVAAVDDPIEKAVIYPTLNIILGKIPERRVLSERLMEALRGFLPLEIARFNYWLKYDTTIDESSMTSLLTKIRSSQSTIIAIRASDGTVFGSFTSSPWRLQKGWFGAKDAFLFRSYGGKIEVYPYTYSDPHIQYCSAHILAVGGGAWLHPAHSPYKKQSTGIGLLIDGDVRGGESNSCATFCNPRLFGEDVTRSGNEFSIEAMEVWTLTPCDDVDAAECRELKQLYSRTIHDATLTEI